MSSALRNAVKRKTHKERSQPYAPALRSNPKAASPLALSLPSRTRRPTPAMHVFYMRARCGQSHAAPRFARGRGGSRGRAAGAAAAAAALRGAMHCVATVWLRAARCSGCNDVACAAHVLGPWDGMGCRAARKKLGLLEKHKDYVLRARDYHRKEKEIKVSATDARESRLVSNQTLMPTSFAMLGDQLPYRDALALLRRIVNLLRTCQKARGTGCCVGAAPAVWGLRRCARKVATAHPVAFTSRYSYPGAQRQRSAVSTHATPSCSSLSFADSTDWRGGGGGGG